MTQWLLSVAAFLLAGAGMALGVWLRGRPLERGCDGGAACDRDEAREDAAALPCADLCRRRGAS